MKIKQLEEQLARYRKEWHRTKYPFVKELMECKGKLIKQEIEELKKQENKVENMTVRDIKNIFI